MSKYNGRNSQCTSEGSGTLTLPRQLVEEVESENRGAGFDLEMDMLLAFEEEDDLLPTTYPDSPEPTHPPRDPDPDGSTPNSGVEETGEGFPLCSQAKEGEPQEQQQQNAMTEAKSGDSEPERGELGAKGHYQDGMEELSSSSCDTNNRGTEEESHDVEALRPQKRQKLDLLPSCQTLSSNSTPKAHPSQPLSAPPTIVTRLEVSGIQTSNDLETLLGATQQHHISAMFGSPPTTPTAESANTGKSQGGIAVIDPDQEWEIRNIVGRKIVGGQVQYLVEWQTTRICESDLGNSRELIDEFEADLKQGQQEVISRSNGLDNGKPKKRRGRPPKGTTWRDY
jgi:hypothetical protein